MTSRHEQTMETKVETIKHTLLRLEETLGKGQTTNETRVGALRRISEAIKYMERRQEYDSKMVMPFSKIRSILLGLGINKFGGD